MNDSTTSPFLIAAVQATPVFLNRAASLDKACALIAETGRAGARLAVFPEGFIPTYPLWAWFIPPYKTQELRELYTELLENSVAVPSRETEQLCAAAAAAGVNYMPLARYALYAWGAQLYVAPTWDRGEPWISTLRHIAKEGRVYVVGCCMPMRREDIPDRYAFKGAYLPESEWLNPGESSIIDPDGKFLVEPVRNKEEILYAEVDPRKMKGPRFQLDVAGHYGRPDLFELTVHRNAHPMVRVIDQPTSDDVRGENDAATGHKPK